MKNHTPFPKSIDPVKTLLSTSLWRWRFLPAVFALICLALSPHARGQVCQDGCFGTNTFLGADALLNNPSGNNTAVGWLVLSSDTSGEDNTATGVLALAQNTIG